MKLCVRECVYMCEGKQGGGSKVRGSTRGRKRRKPGIETVRAAAPVTVGVPTPKPGRSFTYGEMETETQ